MRLELAREMPDAVLVHVDAGELRVASGKPIPYPFTVGVIKRQKNRSLRSMVWTPAASKPRGYPAAARAFLENVIRRLELGTLAWPSSSSPFPVREGVGSSAAQPTNPEGLTFHEWLAAAGIAAPQKHAQARELAAAWMAGEDPPTEQEDANTKTATANLNRDALITTPKCATLDRELVELLPTEGDEYFVPCYRPRAGYSVDDVIRALGGTTFRVSQSAERRAAIDAHAVFAAVCEEGRTRLVIRPA